MCIIITKEKHVLQPTDRVLKRCWDANPQGAGFMFTDPTTRKVHGFKGFMTFEKYTAALKQWPLERMNVVYHFRIATHGGISQQATHPFPLTFNTDDLNSTKWVNRAGIAHNGVIPGYGTKKGLSDTQEWIKSVASKAGEHIIHPGVLSVLEATIGNSRLAIMRRDKIIRLGKGWTLFKGCWYSNSGYKKPKAITYYYPNGNKGWDGLDDDWWKNRRVYNGPITIQSTMPITNTLVHNKPVEPMRSDVSYKDHIALAPVGSDVEEKMLTYPGWCKGQCATCGYFENGFCIIDDVKQSDLLEI